MAAAAAAAALTWAILFAVAASVTGADGDALIYKPLAESAPSSLCIRCASNGGTCVPPDPHAKQQQQQQQQQQQHTPNNTSTWVCDCPYGYGGEDCGTTLLPACTLPDGFVLSCRDTLQMKPCECHRQCKALGRVRHGRQICYEDPANPHPELSAGVFPPDKEFRHYKWFDSLDPPHEITTESVEKDYAPGPQCRGGCSGRGVCWSARHCDCMPGFGGDECQYSRNIYCLNACSRAGKCDRGFCRCDVGRYGFDCSLPRASPTQHTTNNINNNNEAAYPKIYVYELPASISSWYLAEDGWKSDNEFIVSGWIYGGWRYFLQSLNQSPYRTMNPEEADLFFMPMWITVIAMNLGPFDWRMREVIQYIRDKYPYWDRRNGADHIFIQSQDAGPCFVPSDLRTPIMMGHFSRTVKWPISTRQFGPCWNATKDISLPPLLDDRWAANNYYLRSPEARPKSRTTLFYFSGDYREEAPDYSDGVRQAIKRLYANTTGFKVIRSSPDMLWDMMESVFCLAPTGFGWGLRLSAAVVYGCIPVIIQDDTVQAFEDLLPYEEFSVRVAQADIPNLEQILRAYKPEDIAHKQAALARVWRHFLWQTPGTAFASTMTLLARRAADIQRW